MNVIKDKPTDFLLDVDGVLTDGGFYYTQSGLTFKKFGQYDTDALKRLNLLTGIKISFVTSDYKSDINIRRCHDMDFECHKCTNPYNRFDWVSQRYILEKTIYMGDSFTDYLTFKNVYYSIAPNNAMQIIKNMVNYKTPSNGGNGAVAEACIHIYDLFFKKQDEDLIDLFTKPIGK